MKVVWDASAKESFKDQIKHIAKSSVESAENVRQDIFMLLDTLIVNPRQYEADRFKSNNDGNYRAFERHSLRVAYYISSDQIRVLRVRHVKKEPRTY